MKYYLYTFLFAAVFTTLSSCKKNNTQQISNAAFVGQWEWVNSGVNGYDSVTHTSGVVKKVLFNDDGTAYIIHNDSTDKYDLLPVTIQPVLLSKTITDTVRYSIVMANGGCVLTKFSFLEFNNYNQGEYSISNDILQIEPGPCLAPYTTTFRKVQ